MSFDPNTVYNIVRQNPNLQKLVEQAANLSAVQQQVQQVQQMMPQMMPAQNQWSNWGQQPTTTTMAPTQQAMPQPQPQPIPVQQPQTQPQPMQQMSMMSTVLEQAQIVLGGIMNNFNTINGNIKGLYEELDKISQKLDGSKTDKYTEIKKSGMFKPIEDVKMDIVDVKPTDT